MKTIVSIILFTLLYIQLSTSITIDCKYRRHDIGRYHDIYYCEAKSIEITDKGDRNVDTITGEHLPGYSNDEVRAFVVKQKTVHFFPLNLKFFFPSIKLLSLTSTGLVEIHDDDLNDYSDNLEDLLLTYGNLTLLEKNLFKNNPNMQVIDLSNNNINYVEPTIFDNLNFLSSLDMKENKCIDEGSTDRPTTVHLVGEIKKYCGKKLLV